MVKYFLIFLFISFTSCKGTIDHKAIISKVWQYDTGFRLGQGDFVHFIPDDYAVLRSDTIFINGKPKAKIILTKYNYDEMFVRSLISDSVGHYLNREVFAR